MIQLGNLQTDLFKRSGRPSSVRVEDVHTQDIAVIGMAVKLPLADNVEEFWSNIKTGKVCVQSFPTSRREQIDQYLAFLGKRPDEYSYLEAAYLEHVDRFDYKFFRFTPKEASMMSPDQRLFLQTAWEAIEQAGYGGQKLVGSKTGVFLGYVGEAGGGKYRQMIMDVDSPQGSVGIPGNLASIIPSRISYMLDLKGPSMVIDTACSSSLVAVHLACKAIRDGECEMAIVGGIRTDIVPLDLAIEKLGTESSDGRTRTYDENADGSGLGEGSGCVLLKPLARAVQDGDRIYSVIKGSAINQDGHSMSITAPNADAQADVIDKAWQNAGVDPESISYIEAHGTATMLGDVIEMDGLKKAFARYTTKRQFVAIGSVKTNIGHLYQSAGIVGLIKTTLALHYKQLPSLVHFNKPNPKLDLIGSPVYVNTSLKSWDTGGQVRRAGVSSFGLSGTNCHLILEEAPADHSEPFAQAEEGNQQLLALSAMNEGALRRLVQAYRDLLAKGEELHLADLCFTANTGRGHYGHRLVLKVRNMRELQDKLEQLGSEPTQTANALPGVLYGTFKVVPNDVEHKQAHEMTEEERRALNERMANLSLAKESDLDELCRLYVQGADVVWHKLYQGLAVRRMALPTYPFEQESCWLEIPEPQFARLKVMHPAQETVDASKMYYALQWRSDENLRTPRAAASGPVLLFHDRNGLGRGVADAMRARGQVVIDVAWGSAFSKQDEVSYVVGPEASHYEALLADIGHTDLAQIVHLMAIDEESAEVACLDDLEASQQRGVYSVLRLTQALLKSNIRSTVDMVLVADSVYEVTGSEQRLRPEHASLLGLGKVIRQEYPELPCRAVDIDESVTALELLEILDTEGALYQISLREGKRYGEVFGEYALEEAKAEPIAIREDGAYVITGGLGGMGLEVAKSLAAQAPVKLGLINRMQLPPRAEWDRLTGSFDNDKTRKAIRDIRTLEALGAVVEYQSADVANYEGLKRAVEAIRERFGTLRGVVHGAGVAGNGFLIRKEETVFDSVLHPKVYGTWNLDRITEQDDLDFLLSFSSAAAWIGEPGQGDYTAANSYLDAFTAARSKRGRKTQSINWVVWKEVGLGVDNGFARDGLLFHLLTNKQALHAFYEVLNRDVKRVLVGEVNFASDMNDVFANPPFRLAADFQAAFDAHMQQGRSNATVRENVEGDVQLYGKGSGEYTDTEWTISSVCQKVLGFKQLNVYDSFFELGADSLLLKKMHAELEKVFPGQITVADMFSHTSVLKLAQHLDGEQEFIGKGRRSDEEYDRLLEAFGMGELSLDDAIKNLRGL